MTLKNWIVPPSWQHLRRALSKREPRSRHADFLRDTLGWAAPSEVQSAFMRLRFRSRAIDIRSNCRLLNLHAESKRCFVIGNGPSLKEMDLSLLSREITIGANSLYKHRDAEALDLKYLCIGDASFFEDSARTVEWHRTIEAKMPRATLLVHPDGDPLFRRHSLYAKHAVHFYMPGILVNHPGAINVDLMRPLNAGTTTGSKLGIALAVYLGFREINLLGFDCDWLENYRGTYHFYDKHEQFPNFDSPAADSRLPRYEDTLVNVLRDFRAHALWAERLASMGIAIRNATRGGLLDTYPRVRYEDLV